jgi:hypothetical protein
MKLKTLFTLNALVALVFGSVHLLAPSLFWASFGLSLDANGILMARSVGAEVMAFSLLVWLARPVADLKALRAVSLACLVKWSLLLAVNLYAQLSGLLNPMGWSNIVLFVFFASGYAYFLIKPEPAGSQMHHSVARS